MPVTTGLDPVVHAEIAEPSLHRVGFLHRCRDKPSNDEEGYGRPPISWANNTSVLR